MHFERQCHGVLEKHTEVFYYHGGTCGMSMSPSWWEEAWANGPSSALVFLEVSLRGAIVDEKQ